MIIPRYYPELNATRFISQSTAQSARDHYFNSKLLNLKFLLENRYKWLAPYLEGKEVIVEVGSGPGLITEFLKYPIILTDIENNSWVNKFMSAEEFDFKDNSVDVIISCCTLHHLPHPAKFLSEAQRVLKKGGYLLIIEFELSWLTKFLIWFLKIEGWDYNVNVYDSTKSVLEGSGSMDANIAVPHLFFNDQIKFEANFPKLKIKKTEFFECLIFMLSGGVRNRSRMISLPYVVLNFVKKIDEILIKISPSLFALGKKIIIQKI